jgi:transcriptional regulator with XRE-family HTH domain
LSPSAEPTNIPLGEALQFLRQSAKLKQHQVAEKSGVHFTEVSRLEGGRGNPTHLTLQRLAKGLEVPPSYIFMLEDIFERRRAGGAELEP